MPTRSQALCGTSTHSLSLWRPCTGIPCADAAAFVYVSGRVLLKEPGLPLGGVVVSLIPTPAGILGGALAASVPGQSPPGKITAMALSNGSYLLKAPSPGEYLLTITESPDYFGLERTINVPASGLVATDLVVLRPPALRLRLFGPDGTLLTDGDVEVRLLGLPRPAERASVETRTKHLQPDGTMEVVGPHRLVLERLRGVGLGIRAGSTGVARVCLDHWPTSPVDVHLERGAIFKGMVNLPTDSSAADYHILIAGANLNVALR